MSVPVPDLDLAVISGTLSSDPVRRELPSGSQLVTYEVTVRDHAPADTVPVTWIDPPNPPSLRQGDRVVVVGRVRRRFFRVGGATRSQTEVVADAVGGGNARARVRAALERTAALLET